MKTELRTIRAVCPHDCPDTCGLVVTVEGDRAVKLRGDPDHPFTKGFLCQKVANYLERVYHPTRLQFPMRRIGRKGEGKFERIGWDEAIDIIGSRLQSIIDSPHGPQAILPYSYAGTMGKIQGSSLDRRFFHRIGASLLDRTICATAGAMGCDITLGTRAVMDPESIVNARYIVNWGSNTVVTNSHLWAFMHQARKRGAKIVTIDPHRSNTAARSDWWIPVRPGTDGALALGVMHVLFRDGLQDQDYLDRYCLGADSLRDRVLNEYPPAKVSAITDIPVADIERLAHELGRAQADRGGPSMIRLNYGMQRHGGGAMAVRTVCCIPAVLGSWRQVGGGALLSTSRLGPWNTAGLERPDLIPPGTRTINMVQLPEALEGKLPGPPVKALVVYNANPAAVNPDQNRVTAGLARDDLFTVVMEQYPTDTVDYADIVLPATTQLEHWDVHAAYGHLHIQANPPSIPPLGESLPNTEVFRRLARRMGLESALFADDDRQLIQESLQPVAAPNGHPRADAFHGITFDRLVSDGPVRLNLPADYAPFAHGNFATTTGKCHLFSPQEQAAGRDPLPHYIPPHEDPQTRSDLAGRFPLQMICPPEPSFLNSSFANVETLRRSAGEPTLQIHPVDADHRGITDGAMVEIFNDRGRFRAKAVVGATVRPGVVVTFGVWWSKHVGANCNAVTGTGLTDQGGGATFFDNLVEVAPRERGS